MKGLFSKYETADAKTNPLDSIAETLSNSIFFAISKILSFLEMSPVPTIFRRRQASIYVPMSVGRSVGRSVGWSSKNFENFKNRVL